MPQPLFSIIIPTFHRPERLKACLGAIHRLEKPPGGFEVVVVDDGSPGAQESESVIKTAVPSLPLRYIVQKHGGPAMARNRGAEEASGRYLAFIDDDCRPARDWLLYLAQALDSSETRLVGGRVVNGLPGNLFAEASQALMTYMYRYYLGQQRPFFASCNLAIAREDFRRVGGFDTRFPLAAGEDREFCRRSRHRGLKLVFAGDALVHHHHALGPGSFIRQHFNYGRGAMFYHHLRQERGPGTGVAEPLRFYLDLLRFPRTVPGCRSPRGVSLLLGLAQLANAAGFYFEQFSRWRSRV